MASATLSCENSRWTISILLPLSPLPYPSFYFPSFLLEVGPLNSARDLGKRCKLHQWSPAEIKFGTF